MSAFEATFHDADIVDVLHAGANLCWTFRIITDRNGRRHLDGPNGPAEAMERSDLMRHACTFAQSEALHAGVIDY